MNELGKIVNRVFKCVKFTTDFPSSYAGGNVAVLDLQLYVAEKDSDQV